MSLHRVKKSLNVSLPSEHLFPELTSLVPVLLDSEEEESANLVDEEIIKSHIISAGDKDVLLSSSKGTLNEHLVYKEFRSPHNMIRCLFN